MKNFLKIRKISEELQDFGLDEVWEEIPDNAEIIFLKSLYDFINEKSKPKKNTAKFLRMVYDLIQKNEISEESLESFAEKYDIKEKLDKFRKKSDHFKKPDFIKKRRQEMRLGCGGADYDDSCGGGGSSYRSHC